MTVTSTGAELLKIFNLEFVGDAAGEFLYGGDCAGRELNRDESCQISVSFSPSGAAGTRTTTLRIHQNLQGPATDVTVEGVAESEPPPPATSDLFLDSIECIYQAAGTVLGQDALQIYFELQFQGTGEPPNAVRVTGKSSRGPFDSETGGIGPGRRVLALPLRPSDYGRLHTVTLRVDPNHDITESNEDNNLFRVRVHVPPHPASTETFSPCSVS